MSLSSFEKKVVKISIESSSNSEIQEMRSKAVDVLLGIERVVDIKALSKEENMKVNFAIEVLVRIEAAKLEKGWWFRTKRRAELVWAYLY